MHSWTSFFLTTPGHLPTEEELEGIMQANEKLSIVTANKHEAIRRLQALTDGQGGDEPDRDPRTQETGRHNDDTREYPTDAKKNSSTDPPEPHHQVTPDDADAKTHPTKADVQHPTQQRAD